MSCDGAPDVPRYTPVAAPPPADTYAPPGAVPAPPGPKPTKNGVVPSSKKETSKLYPFPPNVVALTPELPPAAP